MPKGVNEYTQPPCRACNIRCAKRGYVLCKRCLPITAAEGTRAQYGEIATTKREQQIKDWIAEYVKMAKKGMSHAQMAEVFGVKTVSIHSKATRLRRDGWKIPLLKNSGVFQRQPPQEPVPTTDRSNEHGGGKWGVTKCKCEPCLIVRRNSRNQWNRDNRAAVAAHRKAAALKKKLGTPP